MRPEPEGPGHDLPIDLDDFDFQLPPERIAQCPAAQRDAARLLVLDRSKPVGSTSHHQVRDLGEWLRTGDLLITNATRVVPARLRGKRDSGGAAEALILEDLDETRAGTNRYRAVVKISGRLRAGIRFVFSSQETGSDAIPAEITEVRERGEVILTFPPGASPYSVGEAPLPPYITRSAPRAADSERYQTVYAREPGAVAAPTAGLHFTPELLERLESQGIARSEVVLHVGSGTFRPLDDATLRSGRLHREHYELPESTVDAIAQTRARGGRVIAVGTTTTRVLEACATEDTEGNVQRRAGRGDTDLFLRPGDRFAVIDGLLTNFHLPRSSLLLLVAAFAGRERVLDAYREAIEAEYRFYSYGDAMLIL